MASKYKEQDVQVTFYDVANRTTDSARASAIASKYSTKDTVNLCVKEKKGLSYELFFLILAVILVFLLVVEFFGIYQPYLAIEQAEARIAEKEARLEQLYTALSDREEVREEFRKYYYEGYPSDIVDREDVLDLIETTIFGKGKITYFNVSGNTLTMSLTEVSNANLIEIPLEIGRSKLVRGYEMPGTDQKYDKETGLNSFRLIVTFKDASEVE